MKVIAAFHQRARWRQAELAREVGISSEALGQVMRQLQDGALPVTRDDSDPPNVWWRVGRGWAAGGVFFPAERTAALLRTVVRSPKSRERDAVIEHLMQNAPRPLAPRTKGRARKFSREEESWLSIVEDSAEQGRALGMLYFSASRVRRDWRYVSVQRVLVGPPARIIARCHRSDTLKWFRVENIASAQIERSEKFREVAEGVVDAFEKASVDGFRGEGDATRSTFFVRDPESHWVRLNLPDGMFIDPAESVEGGVRVHCDSAGVVRAARFLVGLGEAGRAETGELAGAARGIARGALGLGIQREVTTVRTGPAKTHAKASARRHG